jgi:hypothetical protein
MECQQKKRTSHLREITYILQVGIEDLVEIVMNGEIFWNIALCSP